MELGLQVWHDPSGRIGGLRQIARDAESAGYRSLTVPDHLGDRSPAPLAVCALLIEATERVAVGPLVLNNDLRHPVVLAREVAALSELSAGRFELGLGVGWDRSDYSVAGIPFDPLGERIARLASSTQAIRDLCTGRRVSGQVGGYSVHEAAIRPEPRHVPRVLIGGNSRAVLELAARTADIVGLTGFSTRAGGAVDLSAFATAVAERQVGRIGEVASAVGRVPRIQALVQWAQVTRSRRRAAEVVAQVLGITTDVALDSPYVLLGTRREILAQLGEHHDRLGVSRWTIFAHNPSGQPSPLRRFAEIAEALPG